MFGALKHQLGLKNTKTPVVFGAPPEIRNALSILLESATLHFFDYYHIVKRTFDQTKQQLLDLSPTHFYIWQNESTKLLEIFAKEHKIPIRSIQPGCLELLSNRYPDYSSLSIWEGTKQINCGLRRWTKIAPIKNELRRRFISTNDYVLILGSNSLEAVIAKARLTYPTVPLVYLPEYGTELNHLDLEICHRHHVEIHATRLETGPLDAFLGAKAVFTSQSKYRDIPLLLGIETHDLGDSSPTPALDKCFYFDHITQRHLTATEAYERSLGLKPPPLHSGIPAEPRSSAPVLYAYEFDPSTLDQLKTFYPIYDIRPITYRQAEDKTSFAYQKLQSSSNCRLVIADFTDTPALRDLLEKSSKKPYALHPGPLAGIENKHFLKYKAPYSFILSFGQSLNDLRTDILERLAPLIQDELAKAQTLICIIKDHNLSQFTPSVPPTPSQDKTPVVLVLSASPHGRDTLVKMAQNDHPTTPIVQSADSLYTNAPIKTLYTDDHFLGLEALIRGIPVTTTGTPFYAGWGLTDDRYPLLKRSKTLSLEDLVFGIYFKQPTYTSGLTPLTILDQIHQDQKNFAGLETYAKAKEAILGTKFEQGITLFQDLLKTYPNASWFHDFGQELLALKKVLEAVNVFAKAVDLEPTNARYLKDYAFALQLSGDFSSLPADLFKRAIDLTSENPAPYFDRYLRFLWEKEGISKNLLDLCSIYSAKLPTPSSAFLNTYAAILHQAGNTPQALSLYNPNGLNGNCLALRAVYDKDPDPVAKAVVQHSEKFKSVFENLVRENADSFCVIGNSPCELGSGHGPLIDQKKLVIRLNNFSVDFPFAADYGTKTDVWVRNGIAASEVTNRDIPNLRHTLFTGNNYPHRCRSWSNLYEYAEKDIPFSFLPDKVYIELIQKLESLPSTGLKVCYWIYKMLGPIPRDAVFGFSFVDQMKDATKTHYFDHAVPSIRHRWDRELEIFESLLQPQSSSVIPLSKTSHG